MEKGRLFELRRRTFDTAHFRGIEFIEAEAKTIINRVPGDFLPFSYTINPYRGCSHACAYCVHPDTPVLLANGRTKGIADLELGEEIYGTVREGNYRRYVKTHIFAHWSTFKPAYRVTLEDGTELISSGDHRFLSNRGWKYVTGAMGGSLQRPYLTTNNHLRGTGKFADAPVKNDEYRRGYLCGMIRGDGHLGSYIYTRRNGVPDVLHQFRLALVDLEALRRSRDYLAGLSVDTRKFLFQEAVGERKRIYAIRASGRERLLAIDRVIDWPSRPTDDWRKGYLAGIFDAEGSYSRGILRISNTDSHIIDEIATALDSLGLAYTIENPNRGNGLKVIRLLGGLCSALRFFLSVDPAITRKRCIEGQAIKNRARLRVASIEPLGIEIPMFDITTGTGDFIANGVVSHNCFARVTHNYMDMNAGRDFESKIVVKVNAPALLRKELAAKRWKGDHIAMGTATDPYQRAEGRYNLMPQIINILTEFRNPFSILTKGTLILRDLDLLVEAAKVADIGTALSVPTLDEDVWRSSEPGTPHPRKRMDAVRRLNESGIPCGVMVAPILPGISDKPNHLMDVVKAAVDAGAIHITPILLHLRPVVREEYMAWLKEAYPDLVNGYEELYAQGAYGPKELRRGIGRRVAGLVQAAGGVRANENEPRRFKRSVKPNPKDAAKQLQLL